MLTFLELIPCILTANKKSTREIYLRSFPLGEPCGEWNIANNQVRN